MALDGSKLVLASGNKGKLRELAHMLEPLGFEVVSQPISTLTRSRRPA